MEPFVIKEEGFKHLDRVIALCAQQNIYTIIDLYALPGYQNQDWHSDNPTHMALFWRHKHFQDRVVHLWEVIAERYKDNPWVAGYNPINEPGDPDEQTIVPFYQRLMQAIRVIDPNHILFLEGNRYSTEFAMFTEVWPNVIYTVHDYALPGFIDGGHIQEFHAAFRGDLRHGVPRFSSLSIWCKVDDQSCGASYSVIRATAGRVRRQFQRHG